MATASPSIVVTSKTITACMLKKRNIKRSTPATATKKINASSPSSSYAIETGETREEEDRRRSIKRSADFLRSLTIDHRAPKKQKRDFFTTPSGNNVEEEDAEEEEEEEEAGKNEDEDEDLDREDDEGEDENDDEDEDFKEDNYDTDNNPNDRECDSRCYETMEDYDNPEECDTNGEESNLARMQTILHSYNKSGIRKSTALDERADENENGERKRNNNNNNNNTNDRSVSEDLLDKANKWSTKINVPEKLGTLSKEEMNKISKDPMLTDSVNKSADRLIPDISDLPPVRDSTYKANQINDHLSGEMTRILDPNLETRIIKNVKSAKDRQLTGLAVKNLMEIPSGNYCHDIDEDEDSVYHERAEKLMDASRYLKNYVGSSEEADDGIISSAMRDRLDSFYETNRIIAEDNIRKEIMSASNGVSATLGAESSKGARRAVGTSKSAAAGNDDSVETESDASRNDGDCRTPNDDIRERLKRHGMTIPDDHRARICNFLRQPIADNYERPCCLGEDGCTSFRLMQYLKKQHFQTASTADCKNPQFQDVGRLLSPRSRGSEDSYVTTGGGANKGETLSVHSLDNWEPFVLREYLSQETCCMIEDAIMLGNDPKEILDRIPKSACILCNRMLVSTMACRIACGVDKTPNSTIQNHGNVFGVLGEYNKNVKLIFGGDFNGLIKPMVQFNKEDYKPVYYKVALECSTTSNGTISSVRTKTVKGWAEGEHMIHKDDGNVKGVRKDPLTCHTLYAAYPSSDKLLSEWYVVPPLHSGAIYPTEITEDIKKVSLYLWNDDFNVPLSALRVLVKYLYDWDFDHLITAEDYKRYFPFWSVDRSPFVVEEKREYVLLLIRVNLSSLCRCLEYNKFVRSLPLQQQQQQQRGKKRDKKKEDSIFSVKTKNSSTSEGNDTVKIRPAVAGKGNNGKGKKKKNVDGENEDEEDNCDDDDDDDEYVSSRHPFMRYYLDADKEGEEHTDSVEQDAEYEDVILNATLSEAFASERAAVIVIPRDANEGGSDGHRVVDALHGFNVPKSVALRTEKKAKNRNTDEVKDCERDDNDEDDEDEDDVDESINAWERISAGGRKLMNLLMAFWKTVSHKTKTTYVAISYRILKLKNYRNHHSIAWEHANNVSTNYLPGDWMKRPVPQKKCALDETRATIKHLKCQWGSDVITSIVALQDSLFSPILRRERRGCAPKCDISPLLSVYFGWDLDKLFEIVKASVEDCYDLSATECCVYGSVRKDIVRVFRHPRSIALLKTVGLKVGDTGLRGGSVQTMMVMTKKTVKTFPLFGSEFSLLIVVMYVILCCEEKMKTMYDYFPASLVFPDNINKEFGTSTSKFGAFPSFVDAEDQEDEEEEEEDEEDEDEENEDGSTTYADLNYYGKYGRKYVKHPYYKWMKPRRRFYDKNHPSLKNVSKSFQTTTENVYSRQYPYQRSRRFNGELEKYSFALHSYRLSFLSALLYFAGRTDEEQARDDNVPFDLLFPMGPNSNDRMEGLAFSTCYALPEAGKDLRNVEFWGTYYANCEGVTVFWNKASPFRSQCRDMANKISKYCKEDTAFYVYFRLILFLSLTGGYYRACGDVSTFCDWSRYKIDTEIRDRWGRPDVCDPSNFSSCASKDDDEEAEWTSRDSEIRDEDDVKSRMSYHNLSADGRFFNYTVRPSFYVIYLLMIHLFDHPEGEKPLLNFIKTQKIFSQHIWRENLIHVMNQRPFLRENQPHFDMASFERSNGFAMDFYRTRLDQVSSVYPLAENVFSESSYKDNLWSTYLQKLEIEHVLGTLKKMSKIHAFNKDTFEKKILSDMTVLQDRFIIFEMSLMDAVKELKKLVTLMESTKDPKANEPLDRTKYAPSRDAPVNDDDKEEENPNVTSEIIVTETEKEGEDGSLSMIRTMKRKYGEAYASDWEKYYVDTVVRSDGVKEKVIVMDLNVNSYGSALHRSKTLESIQEFVKGLLKYAIEESCKTGNSGCDVSEDYRKFPSDWLEGREFDEAYVHLYDKSREEEKKDDVSLKNPALFARSECLESFLKFYDGDLVSYVTDSRTKVDCKLVKHFLRLKESELEEYRKVTVLSQEIKSEIWKLMLDNCKENYAKNSDKLKSLFRYGGLQAYAKLLNLYPYRTKPKSVQAILNGMKLVDFCRLYFMIRCKVFVSSIRLVKIDEETERKIEDAMFNYRYRLLEGLETLPDSAYDVYVTVCCGRVATSSSCGSYGQDDLRYHTGLNTITCGKKTKKNNVVKNLDGSVRGPQVDPGFKRAFGTIKTFDSKEKLKIAKREKRAREENPCIGAPTIRINLKGYVLYHKTQGKELTTYMHCPTCAQFHVVNGEYANGLGGYMCGSCASMTLERDKKYRCMYCEEEVNADQRDYSLKLPIIDIDSEDNPIFRGVFCRQHAPRGADSVNYVPGRAYSTRKRNSDETELGDGADAGFRSSGPIDSFVPLDDGKGRSGTRGRGRAGRQVTGHPSRGGSVRGRGSAPKCILVYGSSTVPDFFKDLQDTNLKTRSKYSLRNSNFRRY